MADNAAAVRRTEWCPNELRWQTDTMKNYRCPWCGRWVFTQYEGTAALLPGGVECKPGGHQLTWEAET